MPSEQDKQATLDAVQHSAGRLTYLLRVAPDPDAPALGWWSTRDLAAHLAWVFGNYPEFLRGGGPRLSGPREISAANDAHVRAESETDLKALADRIDAAVRELVNLGRAMPAEQAVPWYAGDRVPMTVSSIAALALSEALVHGLDIARATNRRWPIAARDAALVYDGVARLMPHFVDEQRAAGLDAVFDVRIRKGPKLHLVFRDGSLTVETPARRSVDCHLSADPVAFLLVGYRRIGRWGPALRGKMLAWGRRPWLALRFPDLLRTP